MTDLPEPDRRVFFGVAVVCFANLLLEVTFTRIFSATMYYHFTFLAIALALFGLGASGVYVYVRPERFPPEKVREQLAVASRRFAAATLVTVVYVLANPIDILIVTGTSQTPIFTRRTFLQLLLLNGVSALPFFFAGMVVSLAVAHYRRHIDRLYSWDLAGAGLAALAVSPLVALLGAPSLVVAVAVLAMVGAALFERPRLGDYVKGALVLALLAVNLSWNLISVPSVKGVRSERTIFEKWNIFSRVTVDQDLVIKIDASAATNISHLSKVGKNLGPDVSKIAYSAFETPPERALIIGPGGGRDVVNALGAGTAHVTGVEVNPIIAETVMRERFANESGRLYFDPRVDVVTDEGRSFVRRSHERYDVIQASLVDTWAATAAGAFALSENTLYTVEAFQDYYEHLTDRGVVTMTRWHTGGAGESARLLIVAAAALERRGVPPGQTRQHIYYAVQSGAGTLVAKRTPFTDGELDRLDSTARAVGFDIAVSPRTTGRTLLEQYLDQGVSSPLVRAQAQDLSPPTDDRPFFFYFVKTGGLFRWSHFRGDKVSLNNPALWILVSFAAVGALTLAFILVPLFGARSGRRARGAPWSARTAGLAYFAVIGLAFIIVEIALLQKLTFFLGHPSNALLVVLFSILVGTSLGARLTGRVPEARRAQAVIAVALGLAAASALFAFALAPALRAWVAWPWIGRAGLSAIVVLGFGVLMGFLLPLGVKRISELEPELVPWGWGLNGTASVVGTVVATVFAIHAGFSTTLLAGGLLYLLTPLCYWGQGRRG